MLLYNSASLASSIAFIYESGYYLWIRFYFVILFSHRESWLN